MHSSSRYLTNIAPDTLHHQSSTLQQPQPCASDTHTSSGAERQTDDAVDSVVRSALDESSTARLPVFDSSRMTFNPECRDCQISFQHTKPDHLLMYLHAYRYQVRFCDELTSSLLMLLVMYISAGVWDVLCLS